MQKLWTLVHMHTHHSKSTTSGVWMATQTTDNKGTGKTSPSPFQSTNQPVQQLAFVEHRGVIPNQEVGGRGGKGKHSGQTKEG
eukprot:m.174414 g.174414  ORF g.174414 m.174414 type:complete len:83 (+) comp16538_c2_seq21:1580-1828(+)